MLTCPICSQEIEHTVAQKKTYQCEGCDHELQLQIDCDKCGDKLTRLQACGATNLWCDGCNELKSKSSAVYHLVES